MDIREFMEAAAATGKALDAGYSVTELGEFWNVFHDRSTTACTPCVTKVYKVVGSDRTKPHSVVISLRVDATTGKEMVDGWCGDSYVEGRIGATEVSRRQAMALDWARLAFVGHDEQELMSCLTEGYGAAAYKSAGCNFWARKDKGGCKHYCMVLGRLKEGDLRDLREKWDGVMAAGQSVGGGASGCKMDALRSAAFVAPALVIGPPASGKTHTVREFAESIQAEYIEYGCHEGSETTDLLGFTVPYKGGWVWKDGPVAEAFRKASKGARVVLLLDEMLRMPKEQRSALLTAFGEYRGVYTLRTGRIVSESDGVGQEETLRCRSDQLFLVGTTNAGAQFGIEDMDGALKSRFKVMYFGASEATAKEAIKDALSGKPWSDSDKEWAEAKLLDLMRKSEVAMKSAALAAALDLRAVKRMVASSCETEQLRAAADGERLQCVGLGRDGTFIEEQESFYEAMVKKVFDNK